MPAYKRGLALAFHQASGRPGDEADVRNWRNTMQDLNCTFVDYPGIDGRLTDDYIRAKMNECK